MIWLALTLLVIGVGLSAFFSGSETGFYRASRVRIVMDALDGDRLSKFLLFLTNQPALFVATALIGNNLANYITSLGVVLATRCLFPSDAAAAELLAPIMMSPLLYVYGESLPKNLFYMAPNRLLKIAGPFLLIFSLIFAPIALVLWALAQLLEKILGESPDKVRLVLARKELQKVLVEGEAAGILHPTQRLLAQNFFVVAAKPIREVYTPIQKVRCVKESATAKELIRAATRHDLADVPVMGQKKSDILGFYRIVELLVNQNHELPDMHPLREVQWNEQFGEVLFQMQSRKETLTKVIDDQGKTVGTLSIDQLTDPLLKGPLLNLRR
jgi:CBS domain containing-hemolysin-like protein